MKLAQSRNYEVIDRSYSTGNRKTLGVSEEMIGMITSLLTHFYQNPEFATARELLANGVDACIEAGVTPRIEVTTSGTLSSTAEVVFRDYGIGMTPFIFSEIFAAYGESTKRETNDQTGAFGLGCKTPYTMSDTFTVITERDGVKTLGIFTRNEDDLGVADFIDMGETEESGTTITIPLVRNNIRSMEKAVKRAAFALPPGTVTLNGEVCASIHDEAFAVEGHGFVSSTAYDFLSRWNLLMGGIIYPLDNIEFIRENSRWASHRRYGTIVFTAEIADGFLPTPQRDQLRDIRVNRDGIRAKYDAMRTQIIDYMSTYLSENYTHIDAIQQSSTHSAWLALLTDGKNIQQECKWNNKSLLPQAQLEETVVYSKKYRKTLVRDNSINVGAMKSGRVYAYVGMDASNLHDRKLVMHFNARAREADDEIYFVFLDEGQVIEKDWLKIGGEDSQATLVTRDEVYAVVPRTRAYSARSYQITYTVRHYDETGTGYTENEHDIDDIGDDILYIGMNVDRWSPMTAVIPIFFADKKILTLRAGQNPEVMFRRLPDMTDIKDQFDASVDSYVNSVFTDDIIRVMAKRQVRASRGWQVAHNLWKKIADRVPFSNFATVFTDFYTEQNLDLPPAVDTLRRHASGVDSYIQKMNQVDELARQNNLKDRYVLLPDGWRSFSGEEEEKIIRHGILYVEAIEKSEG